MATDWRMIRLEKDGPLAIVTLICGSSSRGVTVAAKIPSSNATSAISGVSRDSRKRRAMRPEMPISGGRLQACAGCPHP